MNAFQALTRGGAIAVPPGGGPLILCYSTPVEGMDAVKFSAMLGGFFETIGEVKNLLTQPDAPDLETGKQNKGIEALKYKA